MNIALCYESVLPARGGCETYIGDLSRRLAADGHAVHLYASRWDASSLPQAMIYHKLDVPKGFRFLRPWHFGRAVEAALAKATHDVTIGFDKTWGQDLLYPQGGLHAASAVHNRRKHSSAILRTVASAAKFIDPAARSFAKLERKQYLGGAKPVIVVNSRMVRDHFGEFYGIGPERLRVVHSAIDPNRFVDGDRAGIHRAERELWNVADDVPIGLFVAMNYRLKGLAPLIRSLVHLPADIPLKLAIVGHPKFARYQKLAESLGVADRVLFLGFRASPKTAYFAADFLVHPTFYDPCSLVVLEALACGLPVITTRYNGAGELLNASNGIVIDDPHDGSKLAAALAKMCDNDFRIPAVASARIAARAWTFEMHYQALLALFEEIRAEKNTTAA